MDIKDSYLHGTVGVVKSISVTADKLSYKLADVAGTTKTVTLPLATQSANGLLSKEDKTKLDNMVATKVANDLILKINSGATEGTSLYTYNGSSAKTLDIKSGTGIGFTNNAGSLQIYNTGVRSIATGTTNGTISVNTNGTSSDVAVKGLGSAAYKETVNFLLIVHRPSLTNGSNTYDLNNSYNSDCIIHDYQWTNSPNNKINSVINLVYLTDWKNQLMFTPLLTTISYRSYSGDTKSWSNWKTVAFTDSNITGNAATADRLKNKVKLWGLDFDGTADVSGNIISTYFELNESNLDNSYLKLSNKKQKSTYVLILTNGLTAIGSSYTHLVVDINGNVGIGTTSPSAKLHIAGGLLNITNGSYGTLTIGSQNAYYTHYSTTGGTHWFNKQIEVAGYLYPHFDNKHSLGSSGKRWSDFYSMLGNFYGHITFLGENLGVYGGGKGILGSMDSSNTWDGIAGYACNVVGSINKPLVLRSSSDDLYHYNHATNTKYSILDTGNVLTLSDVGININPYASSTGWYKFMTLVGTTSDGTVDFIISTSETANRGVADYFHFETRPSSSTRTFTCSHLGNDDSYIRANIYAYTSDNKTYTFWLKYSEANTYARLCRVRHILSRGCTITYHSPTFQTSTPSGTSYLAVFAGSVKFAEEANKIGGLTLSGLDARYVNVSGDTMTGALYFSDNVGVYNSLAGMLAYVTSGNGWTGATNLANTVVVGTTSANTVIRSSGDTLYHYNTSAGSRYKIWDAGNSNLYTVPWSVSLLHIGASNKFLGTDSGVNNIWVKCGDIYMLNCTEAESCVRRGTNAAHITLGSSTYPWKGLYSGTGHFTGNVTLYSASGDSPMLYFLRGDINYTDTFDWRMFVSGGHFYLQHGSGAWTNGLQINYTGEAYVHGALILTTSNITSRNLTINGTARSFYSGYSTDCGNIYAPTTAGTANLYLISNGSGAPIWKTIDPYDYNISRTANTVLAAPNGSAGKATFRKLVVADLPISARSLTVNGTAYTFYSSTTTAAASFYAPTGAGTSGYILQSNGSGAPSWTSRLSYSYPGVIWVGYIYRTARSYTTWYASSQGGSASVSMYISSPTSSNNYQVALQSSTHTILGGMCSIQAQFNAGKDGGQTTEGPLYAYSTVDVSKIEEAGPDVLVSSVYGGRFYIKAMRASDANNTSYYFDGLAFTGAGKDTNSLPLARINIILFGY